MHGPITRTLDNAGRIGVLEVSAGGDDDAPSAGERLAGAHVAHVILRESMPGGGRSADQQLDRLCGARNRVRKAPAGAVVVHRELLAPDDPARSAERWKL